MGHTWRLEGGGSANRFKVKAASKGGSGQWRGLSKGTKAKKRKDRGIVVDVQIIPDTGHVIEQTGT